MMNPGNVVLVLMNAVLLVGGQFLWKAGMQSQQADFSQLMGVARVLLSPYILSGLVIYGFATILWLYIISRVQLSLAYPMQSMAYVFAVVAAHYLFDEALTPGKIIGALVIVLGVSIIALTGNSPLTDLP